MTDIPPPPTYRSYPISGMISVSSDWCRHGMFQGAYKLRSDWPLSEAVKDFDKNVDCPQPMYTAPDWELAHSAPTR